MSRSNTIRIWLLEIDLGHLYLFASEPAVVVSESGVSYVYEAGLSDPGATLAQGSSADEASVGLEVLSEVDWALLAAQGIPLEARRATLRRWESGTTLERARVILRGRLSEVTYGRAGEVLTARLTRSISRESDVLPHPQAVIDASTWPITGGYAIPERSRGVAYPVVIGAPGHTASGNPLPAVPLVYAQYGASSGLSYLALCDGLIDAGTVRLYNFEPSTPTSADATVTQVVDELGRTVSVLTAASLAEEGRWFAGFADRAGYGGGIVHQGRLVRGAGDLWRWVFEEHVDTAMDWGRFEAIRPSLNTYKIDTVINSETNVWDWFTGEVLPLLPIEIRESSRGLYPALMRWGATSRDAVAHLDGTSGTGRVSRVSAVGSTGEIRNEITIQYRPTGESGNRWANRRVATSVARRTAIEPATVDDDRIRGSRLLTDSQLTYGVLPLTIEAACVSDDGTADLVLRDRIRAHAWPRRTVSYEGGPWLESLGVGDVVTLADPDLHIESLTPAVALVLDVVPGAGSVQVDLMLLDHPLQISRST